jgi:Zn-dependent M28 family amino/carboxypeptidase
MSSRDWNQTVIFLATSAEEQGLSARFFAENAFWDGKNVIAAINYDAVGGRAGVPQHVRLFAVDYRISNHGALGAMSMLAAASICRRSSVLIQDALDREGRWGDHREFVRVGFPPSAPSNRSKTPTWSTPTATRGA